MCQGGSDSLKRICLLFLNLISVLYSFFFFTHIVLFYSYNAFPHPDFFLFIIYILLIYIKCEVAYIIITHKSGEWRQKIREGKGNVARIWDIYHSWALNLDTSLLEAKTISTVSGYGVFYKIKWTVRFFLVSVTFLVPGDFPSRLKAETLPHLLSTPHPTSTTSSAHNP